VVALLQHLHLSEIGMGGARIGDRHQRAVECGDGDIAGGGQHAIAGKPGRGNDQAHRHESDENFCADTLPSHRGSPTILPQILTEMGFMAA
jgi:hypothetical protein